MRVWFGQIYIEPGVNCPWSTLFQQYMSREISALVDPSKCFIDEYGDDYNLVFNVSAKQWISDNEIRGPKVFRRTKDVEFTLFVPFDRIVERADGPEVFMSFLIDGVVVVLETLSIDSSRVRDSRQSIIDIVCSNRAMLAAPSWDPAINASPSRQLFARYFSQKE